MTTTNTELMSEYICRLLLGGQHCWVRNDQDWEIDEFTRAYVIPCIVLDENMRLVPNMNYLAYDRRCETLDVLLKIAMPIDLL